MPDGDLGDMLPRVGEDAAAADLEGLGGFRPSNVSQFSLLEESGTSMAPYVPSSRSIESLHTLEVLA